MSLALPVADPVVAVATRLVERRSATLTRLLGNHFGSVTVDEPRLAQLDLRPGDALHAARLLGEVAVRPNAQSVARGLHVAKQPEVPVLVAVCVGEGLVAEAQAVAVAAAQALALQLDVRVLDQGTEVVDHAAERDLVEQAQLQLTEVGDPHARASAASARAWELVVLLVADLESERRAAGVARLVGQVERLAVEHDLFAFWASARLLIKVSSLPAMAAPDSSSTRPNSIAASGATTRSWTTCSPGVCGPGNTGDRQRKSRSSSRQSATTCMPSPT